MRLENFVSHCYLLCRELFSTLHGSQIWGGISELVFYFDCTTLPKLLIFFLKKTLLLEFAISEIFFQETSMRPNRFSILN